jgi:phospholipid/cholesterol/gamma-HCH transport system permease protein
MTRLIESGWRQLTFYLAALTSLVRALRHWRDILALAADVAIGAGALVVGGGMFFVVFLNTFFTGTEVGLEGYSGLHLIGAQEFTGVITALANTREITPIVAGIALASQVGAGFTAQLGAMAVNDEIDALSVMGVEPIAALAGTRIWAVMTVMIPLYLAALLASLLASDLIVTHYFSLPGGVYLHYLRLFLPVRDVLVSVLKALVFALIVCLVHCYYGFYATGGPAGVGRAAGRALRASIIAIVVADMVMSLAFYGSGAGVRLVG